MSATEKVVLTAQVHDEVLVPAAQHVWSQFREFVDLEDLVSEAYVWWYGAGQAHLPGYLADENYGRLRRSIWRACMKYARKEKAAKIGYDPADQYRYPAPMVLSLLPLALDPDAIPEPVGIYDGSLKPPAGDPAEGGNLLAHLVDVRRALGALPDDDVIFLSEVDEAHQDYERVARAYDITTDAARRRHARIADRMARWLAREDAA